MLTFFVKLKRLGKVRHGQAKSIFLRQNPRRDGPPRLHQEASAGHKLLGDVAHPEVLRDLAKHSKIALIHGHPIHVQLGRLTQGPNLLRNQRVALRRRV